MRIIFFILLTGLLLGLLPPGEAVWACRYNVRDVGFVQFESAPYTMIGYTDASISPEKKKIFQQVSFAALLDSNIEFQTVDLAEDKENPARRYLSQTDLRGTPAFVLVSSKGDSLPIPLIEQDKNFKDSVWFTLDGVVSSPLRDALVLDAIRAYCVILLAEGADAAENNRVKEIIQAQIQRVRDNLADLPKPVERPPVMRILSRQDCDRDPLLAWSMDLAKNWDKPRVAVLYGRARRVGSVLTGDEITRNSLSNLVTAIGLSCECGLDRSWMMGTMIPLRWTNDWSEETARRLGFDPESPMIRTEIAQILSTSASRAQPGRKTGGDALLGYGEITLDIQGAETPETEETVSEAENDSVASEIAASTNANAGIVDSIADRPIPLPESAPTPTTISSSYWGAILISGGLIILSFLGGFFILWKARGQE
jgi:hypothetical protein